MANEGKSQRGFASMDDEKQRDIARKGGESVPDEKRSFSRDRELAAEAGREGGRQSQGGRGGDGNDSDNGSRGSGGGTNDENEKRSGGGGRGSFAEDRERASEAGRKGGRA
jgi:uncharacterized protein